MPVFSDKLQGIGRLREDGGVSGLSKDCTRYHNLSIAHTALAIVYAAKAAILETRNKQDNATQEENGPGDDRTDGGNDATDDTGEWA